MPDKPFDFDDVEEDPGPDEEPPSPDALETPADKATLVGALKLIIDDLASDTDQPGAPAGDVVEAAVEARDVSPESVRSTLDVMERDGRIYAPREDRYRVTPP